MEISGNIVDVRGRKIYHGRLRIENGVIKEIEELPGEGQTYIMPGFIDAHIHIESSMLVPTEFSRLATPHGTVATISDPHEIANVLGMEGVEFMIENASAAALKIHFGAPSCVPATGFETAGARLGPDEVKDLLANPKIYYLAEMMNYPGVIQGQSDVKTKLEITKKLGLPIDGHAPGLLGSAAQKYFSAGITTDHECITYEEAKEKALMGVNILIREGSAAKNYAALHPLIDEFPRQVMFCSDDKHPDDLMEGHINQLVIRSLADGHAFFDVLYAACVHPIDHYKIPVGTLQIEDPADFIILEDLLDFRVLKTFIDGQVVAEEGVPVEKSVPTQTINNFNANVKNISQFEFEADGWKDGLPIIQALDRQLITEQFKWKPNIHDGFIVSDLAQDVLKMVVINRYLDCQPAVAFVRGFGLQKGAIASCVAHDSHNIIAVGISDEEVCQAVNLIIATKGGIAAVNGSQHHVLPLPVAGIMSDDEGEKVAEKYQVIDRFAKEALGSKLTSPYMTLSFMALLVIPKLKLSDKGLFDGEFFEWIYQI